MEILWESFLIQLIAFLILYFLLQKYAFGPLFGIMEKRKQHIQDQLSTAEQNRKQAEVMLSEQKDAIEKARQDAFNMIEQAKSTSSKQADEIIAQAKKEAVRLKEEAIQDIETEKNKAVAELRSQVSGMAVLIASKIVEKQIDEASQQELIDKYLTEVGGNR